MAAFAGVFAGCAEHRAASPLSPSSLSARSSEDVRPAVGTFAPRGTYHDGDEHDDDPEADPGTDPAPNPEQPPPDGTPVQLTINVVASFGSSAFAPNPLQAAIGNTIVWTNNDLVQHDIVFDDGTPIGNLAPGQSSMPIALVAETASYHCTLHPSMVGQVTTIPAENPPPTDPSGNPPSNDGGGGDAGGGAGGDAGGDDGYGDYDYY